MSYIEATLKTELVDALRKAGCKADKFPDLARVAMWMRVRDEPHQRQL